MIASESVSERRELEYRHQLHAVPPLAVFGNDAPVAGCSLTIQT
jgi:hypothetical protein